MGRRRRWRISRDGRSSSYLLFDFSLTHLHELAGVDFWPPAPSRQGAFPSMPLDTVKTRLQVIDAGAMKCSL
ncbi:unnamed protein product [Urochloa humidicola]